MRSMRSAVVAMVALLLSTGCSAQSSSSQTEEILCPPVTSRFSTAPATGPAHHVELGDVQCSDGDTGMSAVDITVKNTGAGEANYYVTVEFIDSEQHSIATEHTYFSHVSASATMSLTAYAVRPIEGRGMTVRLVDVKREVVATNAPAAAPTTALDRAVELFVDQGLVPADAPYGDCPDAAPQTYWIGDEENCWSTVRTLPSLPATPTPAQPTLPAPTPTPVFPGTLCADGSVSRSSGRGTCSHHGGIDR